MDEYTTNDVDKRILRDLLESWNLSCIYNKLDAFGLDIESLTLLNEQDISTIFPKDNEMGIRIKLRDKISKWRVGEVKESPSQSLNVMKRSFSPNTDPLSEPIILPESGMDNSTKIEALFENLTLLELLQALREDPSPNRRDLVCNNIISQMLDMRCLLSVSDFSIISDEIVKRAPNEHKEVFFFYNNRRPSGKLYYKFKNACHNRRKVGLLEHTFKRRKMTNAGPSTSSQMANIIFKQELSSADPSPNSALLDTIPESECAVDIKPDLNVSSDELDPLQIENSPDLDVYTVDYVYESTPHNTQRNNSGFSAMGDDNSPFPEVYDSASNSVTESNAHSICNNDLNNDPTPSTIHEFQQLAVQLFPKLNDSVTGCNLKLDRLLLKVNQNSTDLRMLRRDVLLLQNQNAKTLLLLGKNEEGIPNECSIKLPFESIEQLQHSEIMLMDPTIRSIFVQNLRLLKGLHDTAEKTLARLFSDGLLANHNWDGRKGQASLKVYNTIFDAVFDDDCLNEFSGFHKHGTLPDLIETLPEEIQIDFYNHSQNENLFEVAMPYYDMDDFKTHFQMSRNSFEELMLVTTPYFNSLEFIPVKQKLLLTLWLLTHRESFVAGGDRFGMAPSSAHIIFTETVDILKDLLPNYVRFPDHAEQIRIASKFRNIYAIPGIIGSIAVCRISIKEPEENSIHFYNQNGVHSIILQAVCDDRLCFTDVHIGMPGRMSIVNVFERSQIYTKLSNPGASLFFSGDHHLVGDKEYPNSNVLITPYDKNPASLTHAQTKFNEALTSAHQVIQKCFINFKSKYKRLEYLDMEYLELSNSVIAACCVLHNFTIQFDGNWTDLPGEEGLDGDYDEMDGVFYDFPDDDEDNGSFKVRDDDDSMCYLRPDKRLLYTSYFE